MTIIWYERPKAAWRVRVVEEWHRGKKVFYIETYNERSCRFTSIRLSENQLKELGVVFIRATKN